MIGQTFSFSHCISTLLIWCCSVSFRVMNTSIMGTPCDVGLYWKDGGLRKIVPQGPWKPHLALTKLQYKLMWVSHVASDFCNWNLLFLKKGKIYLFCCHDKFKMIVLLFLFAKTKVQTQVERNYTNI